MKEFRYKKIDAFATVTSDGNPAGYIWLDFNQQITAKEMQQIAREQKGFVNEVGFVRRTGTDTFELKYYSAEKEVDFCGHATIAIMYNLIQCNPDLQQLKELFIENNKGKLLVYNHIETEDAVFILSPTPEYRNKTPNLKSIALNLGITYNAIDDKLPIKIINAGLTTLIVPIVSLDAILNISPNIDMLKDFCISNNIDIIEVFTNEVTSPANDYRTRVFAPTFGYLEDPATGSGNSAFGYYLLQLSRWEKETLTIEQNDQRQRFNVVKLRKETDIDGKIRVLFGGSAIVRMEGSYYLH